VAQNWRIKTFALRHYSIPRSPFSTTRYESFPEAFTSAQRSVLAQIRGSPGFTQHQLVQLPAYSAEAEDISRLRGPHTASLPLILDSNMAYVQFVATPTVDTPGAALVLHFDDKRYIFGRVAEGFQRRAIQGALSFKKLNDVFITGPTEWSSIGGILGLVLTVADSILSRIKALQEAAAKSEARKKEREEEERLRVEQLAKSGRQPKAQGKAKKQKKSMEADTGNNLDGLHIYGPPNLLHAIGAARKFVFRQSVHISVDEIGTSQPEQDGEGSILPTWKDSNINVWALRVKDTSEETVEEGRTRLKFHSRKRRYEEVNGPDQLRAADESLGECEQRYRQIRQAVIHEMFDSEWRRDALFEMPLREVGDAKAIWIRHPDTKNLTPYDGPLPSSRQHLPNPHLKVLVRKPWPGAMISNLPPTMPKHEALSYIVKTHPVRGKFQPRVALSLGLEDRTQWGRLTAGESIENKHGELIAPDAVMGETEPGSGFAVIDLPTAGYVRNLLDRPEWSNSELIQNVKAFIWILGPGVSSVPTLHDFMRRMKEAGIEQIVASPDHCPNTYSMQDGAAFSAQLAAIDPAVFSPPKEDGTVPQRTIATMGFEHHPLDDSFRAATTEKVIKLLPKLDFNDAIARPAKSREVPMQVTELAALGHQQNESQSQDIIDWQSQLAAPDAEIITLGTGSALPSKYRNVSATLVRVPGRGSYLLDCGENTLGQLQRVYNTDELLDVLKDLRMIWLSHPHADHHLGTVSLVKAWFEAARGNGDGLAHEMTPKHFDQLVFAQSLGLSRQDQRLPYLSVVSEPGLLQFLHEYSQAEDFGFSRVIPLRPIQEPQESSEHLDPRKKTILQYWLPHGSSPSPVVPRTMYGPVLGLEDIQVVPVKHCANSYAVALTCPPDGEGRRFKVAYSGDCRPSKAFAVIGEGATVLIHEATFGDELSGEARAKYHSTTGEALMVGEAMGAKAVVLTHFSQRYSKLPDMKYRQARSKDEVMRELSSREGASVVADFEGDLQADATDVSTSNNLNDHGSVSSPTGYQKIEQDDGLSLDEFGNITGSPKDAVLDNGSSTAPAADASLNPGDPMRQTLQAGESAVGHDMKVCIAFDYMRIRVKDIVRMEALAPAFMELLKDDDGQKKLSRSNSKDTLRSTKAPATDGDVTSQSKEGHDTASSLPQTGKANDGQDDKITSKSDANKNGALRNDTGIVGENDIAPGNGAPISDAGDSNQGSIMGGTNA
jgi:ribonuclease Z